WPTKPAGASEPSEPPQTQPTLPPPRGEIARPFVPDAPAPETRIPGNMRPDFPRPSRPAFAMPSERRILFQPGDLLLLTLNGICKVDLAAGRVGLTHRLEIDFPHAFYFRSPEELFVVSGRTQTSWLGVFQPDGSRTRIVSDIMPPSAKGHRPTAGCIVVDNQGSAYTPRSRDFGLTKITPDGRGAILNRTDDLTYGEAIPLSRKGQLFIVGWVPNQANIHRVFRIDPESGQMTELVQLPDGSVSGMAADAGGTLYLCSKNQVLKLPRGVKTPQVLAEINRAYRVAIGPDGAAYV